MIILIFIDYSLFNIDFSQLFMSLIVQYKEKLELYKNFNIK